MIRFVKHEDIDQEKWNQAVKNARFSTLFAQYKVLDALTCPDTWHALIEDDYLTVMPLPERSKLGISYLYTPFFMPQMGIFSPKHLTSVDTHAFLDSIPKKYVQADLILNRDNDSADATAKLVSHALDLQKPYQSLRAQFSQNTVRNIRDAERQDTVITFGEPIIEETIRLFRENRGQDVAVHFQGRDYERLVSVARLLDDAGALRSVSTRTAEGVLIAGALFVLDGDRLWFWFSGRDNRYASHKPLFILMDAVIRQFSEQPLTLDFNGSVNPNVARMYQSFGGEAYPIPLVTLSRVPCLKKMAQLVRKLRK
ncbi:MAG: GNAT family N-acetyltransferase [Bacteroidales bacterium]|nr:GNAT family N-acetyltransferase [Bacteroidales bacterium]